MDMTIHQCKCVEYNNVLRRGVTLINFFVCYWLDVDCIVCQILFIFLLHW